MKVLSAPVGVSAVSYRCPAGVLPVKATYGVRYDLTRGDASLIERVHTNSVMGFGFVLCALDDA